MSLAWALVESSPLNMLSAEHSERMMRLMRRRRLSPGERLELGKTATGWWVVESGLMKMYQVAPDGSSLTYALLKPGDSFGETDILTGHWVRAMVEALEPSTVRYLPAEQFQSLLRESPDFALALLRVMAERIRQSQERVFHISRPPGAPTSARPARAGGVGRQTASAGHRNPSHAAGAGGLCGRDARGGQPHPLQLEPTGMPGNPSQERRVERPPPVANVV